MRTTTLARLGLAVATAAIFGGCSTQATQDTTTTTDAQSAARAPQAATPARPAQSTSSAASASDAKAIPGKRSVYYEYDKAEITAEGKKLIEAHADYLRARPALKVVIEGNADERGSAEYNVALGQRRADGVSKIMTLLGVAQDRIETVSFGKEKPKASGHNETSWSENRRSDIVYR
ncbi:MAG TPA: peptidoglycan-associated lipoprotein Pal [Burkholderiales bacterium]|jgi:peptidoglycan-associated lipoprotein